MNATIRNAQATVKSGVGQSNETGTSASQSNTDCESNIFQIKMKEITSYSTYRGRENTKNQEGPVHHASSQRRLRKPGQTSTRFTAIDGMCDVMEARTALFNGRLLGSSLLKSKPERNFTTTTTGYLRASRGACVVFNRSFYPSTSSIPRACRVFILEKYNLPR